MKRILILVVSIAAVTSVHAGDVALGLQGGLPGLLGPRISYLGGEPANRTLVVDATAQLSLGVIYSIGAGYSISGGPFHVGLRYHYLIVSFLVFDALFDMRVSGGAIGPEFGVNTPIFGSESVFLNAVAGVAFRNNSTSGAGTSIGWMPNLQVGINFAL